ncbi:hypothetical protein [Accumulibacter sp.]|uniref:hypothetical protein n=1 Tax=Accumulibacter sp. TaxID=2053492 RepID=UPI00261D6A46|nr:hypothetical protein [Accumulibacter sp.]
MEEAVRHGTIEGEGTERRGTRSFCLGNPAVLAMQVFARRGRPISGEKRSKVARQTSFTLLEGRSRTILANRCRSMTDSVARQAGPEWGIMGFQFFFWPI